MEDKRQHPRFPVSSNKSCWLQYTDDSTMVAGIRDISRKGIRITSDSPLRDTNEDNFVIKSSWLDHDIPVKVRIVWQDTTAGIRNYGARFISINPENVFELLDSLYHDWVEESSQSFEQFS